MLVAPGEQGPDGRPEVGALAGQRVLVVAVRAGNQREHARLDQGGEPLREHRAGNVQVGGEVAEPPHAEEGVADDEQRPPLPHDLQRARQRAAFAGIILRQRHGGHNNTVSSLTEPCRACFTAMEVR